jgi:putative FmdB family regulatory protein
MPTYVYICKACQKTQEIMQKITEDALTTCPLCGQKALERTIAASVAIQFKGSGFYITDYAKDKPSNGQSGNGQSGHGCGSGSCGCK